MVPHNRKDLEGEPLELFGEHDSMIIIIRSRLVPNIMSIIISRPERKIDIQLIRSEIYELIEGSQR